MVKPNTPKNWCPGISGFRRIPRGSVQNTRGRVKTSISSTFLFRDFCCSSVIDHWPIFIWNVVPSGIFSWCSMPGIVLTSLIASAKQLVNSSTTDLVIACCLSVRSSPSVILSSILATYSFLKGSVCQVKTLLVSVSTELICTRFLLSEVYMFVLSISSPSVSSSLSSVWL